MSWGKGITIAMIAFMTFILYMVFTLMSRNTDLESEDYYQKELNFEKEISALKNTNKLKEKVKVTLNDTYVIVQFPNLEELDSIKVELYRPNNDKDDQVFSVQESKVVMIPKSKLKKGVYEMNIQYQVKRELYMQKESIEI
ncbi:MAG: FixH family protein [Fluviicola sp.]|jgi:hypothetical protein|nr:FixH family protein [Fluviicola sp.]